MSGGLFASVVESVLTPGVAPFIVTAIHGTFVSLLVVLAAVFCLTDHARIHVGALWLLAAGLYASITWFIAEQKKEAKKAK
jgi:hypothetical protein